MKTPERRTSRAPHTSRIRPTALYVAILVAAFGGSAQAARLNYQFELEALHSDNINLSENNQAEETVLVPRLIFDFTEQGSAVEIQAQGEIERRNYSGNEFDDETRSAFAGQLNWSLLPQRLHFVVEDYLTEEPINFRDGRYPGNLQQVNVFVAGPSLYARLGSSTRFQLDVRGADTYAEETLGFDSRRFGGAAILEHDVGSTAKASLHLASLKVEFDDPDPVNAVDYVRDDGFLRYQGTLRKVEYEFDAGYSRLDFDAGGDESTSIARATLRWQINPESRLRFRARRHFADEVQDLIIRLRDPDEELVPDLVAATDSLVTGGVYRQQDAELDYRFVGERLGFRLRPVYRKLRYIGQTDRDRSERNVNFEVSYRLRPLTTVFFEGAERRREFLTIDEVDRDHVYSLGLEQQMSRHWGWRGELLKNDRDSNLPDPRYEENAVQLVVWWKR